MWSLSHPNILLEVSRQPSLICDITLTTTVWREGRGGVGDNIGLPTQACCPRGVCRRRIVNPWHAWRALLVSKPQFLAPKPQISCSEPQILSFKPQIQRPKTPKRVKLFGVLGKVKRWYHYTCVCLPRVYMIPKYLAHKLYFECKHVTN